MRPQYICRPFAFAALLVAGGCTGPALEDTSSRPSLDEALEIRLRQASNGRGLAYYRLPDSRDFDTIPQDPENPVTPAKVELGQLLFHETALGAAPNLDRAKGTYSCATCHHAPSGFRGGAAHSIAEGGVGFGTSGEGRRRISDYPPDSIDAQPVRSPSALNVAYQENILWNGSLGSTGMNEGTKYAWSPPLRAFNRLGFRGAETQAFAAMKGHGLTVEEGLVEKYPDYRELFDAAFPDVPAPRRYTNRQAGLAIAAYERTLLANRAPFQRWLRGERDAMSGEEKRGALLFFGEARCHECHNGPSLASMRFEALGMKDLFQTGRAKVINDTLLVQDTVARLGRGGFTRRRSDRFRFKVPQLYNVADARFYGHGSSFSSLREVVAYKNAAQPEDPDVAQRFLSDEFVPLGLTAAAMDALVAFLETSLQDPELNRYVPESLPSGKCFPNDDPVSRKDLGCVEGGVARW